MIVDSTMQEPWENSFVALALEVAQALEKHYPAHPWSVSFQGGALIVRHGLINAYAAEKLKREGFGFVIPKNQLGNPKEVRAAALEAGGAMLELFGLPRGRYTGEDEPRAPSDWKIKQEGGFS